MSDTLSGSFSASFGAAHALPITGSFSMNFSAAGIIAELDGLKAAYNGGSLVLYGGQAFPATPETAITGTGLVSFTFASPAFGADVAQDGQTQTSASFTTGSVAPTASGTAIFARAFRADGVTALSDHIVAAPWQPSAAVVTDQCVTLGGALYRCVAGGTTGSSGPTGTGAAISDGTATWTYVGPSNAGVLVFGSTTVTLGVPVTMTAFILATGPPVPEALTITSIGPVLTGAPVPLSGTYVSGPPLALDYSIDNQATWHPLGAPIIIAGDAWSGTGPTFTVANAAQTVSIRDHSNTSVVATTPPFAVTVAAPVETLTIAVPVGAVAGQAVPMSGTWAVTQPTLFEYSVNAGGTWNSCPNPPVTVVRSDGTWQTTGPIFAVARTGISLVVRDRLRPAVTATTPTTFNVGAAPSLPETLTCSVPPNVRVGQAVPLSGTYTNGPPAALDYSIDNGASWTPLGAPVVIGALSWSGTGPTFVTANPAQGLLIRDHATPSVQAPAITFAVQPPLVETLTIVTPTSAFVGTPLGLQGSFTNGPPAALEYSIDGTTFVPLVSATISGGLWSGTGPTYATQSTIAQITIRDPAQHAASAQTGVFTVFAATGAAPMTDTEGNVMTDTEAPPDVMLGP